MATKAKARKALSTAKTKAGTKHAVAAKTPAKRPGKAAPAKPARKAKARAKPIPAGFRSLTPYLIVRGADQAMHFYAVAFGARVVSRMAMPDGSVMHAELKIGDSMFMLSEEFPDWGAKSPLLLGGSATHVMIYTRDVDALVARALAAGAHLEMPVAAMFWGDRYGKVKDPFGHVWSIATHVEDVPPKEMQKRANAFMAQGPG